MRRQPSDRPENVLALAVAEVDRIKALLSRVTDSRGLVISTGSAEGDTTPPVEAGAHTLYGVKHTRAFRVTDGGGLDIDFEQGQIWMSGTFYSVAASSLTLADDDTSYVFVDNSGAVADNVTGFPGDCWPIAEVTTVGGDITAIADRRSYSAQGVWDGTMDADEILLPRVSGSTYDDVEDANTLFGSAGWFSGGALSDAGGGNINVTAGTGVLRSAATVTTQLLFIDWPASAGNAIPVGTTRYIGVEWNMGVPQVTVRATENFDNFTDFELGIAVREPAADGGTIHIDQHEHHAGDVSHRVIERWHQTNHIERDNELNGNILGESNDNNRNVETTAGAYWVGLDRAATGVFDSSGADTFDTYSAGGREAAGVSVWPNAQYDNGGALANLGGNKWANLWWYQELDGELVMVYGTAQYNTEAMAGEEAKPTTVPDRVTVHGTLIGRYVFQVGDTIPSQVQTIFVDMFNAAGVTVHSGLSGIGGGEDDHPEYLLADGTRNLAGNMLVDTDKEIRFRDTPQAIFSSAADQLDLRAVTAVQIDAPATVFTGQLQATVQGGAGGLLVGGDAQWYRSAPDTWRTPDAVIIDGLLSVDTIGERTGNAGVTVENVTIIDGSIELHHGTDTIAGDEITAPTGGYIIAAAQAGVTDDLDGIGGGAYGRIIVVRADAGDTITVKHNDAGGGAGRKILLNDNSDLALVGNDEDNVTLMYDESLLGAAGAWFEISRGEGGGGAVDAADVTYTPAVNADWDADADPGDVDEALDELAERTTDIEERGVYEAQTSATLVFGESGIWYGPTPFTGTINGAPTATTIVYNVTAGENSIMPGQVIHNTTLGERALIEAVNYGTNTLTVEADSPHDVSGWANTNALTTASQTNLGRGGIYTDIDVTSVIAAGSAVTGVVLSMNWVRRNADDHFILTHPYEAFSANKENIVMRLQNAESHYDNWVQSVTETDGRYYFTFCTLNLAADNGAGNCRIQGQFTKLVS